MIQEVVVTGAHGFIGRHMARLLNASGYRVVGIGHGAWTSNEWRRWGLDEWYQAGITLESLSTYARDPSLIVHCAGSGAVGLSLTQPYRDYLRTTQTTASVLEFVRLFARNAAIVLPSSAAVYGTAQNPIAEGSPLRPASPYGVHKRLAEELCLSYARHYGLSTAVVRLFSVYGVGLRKQLLWDACSKMARGELSFFGTGNERRDWIHVDDAVSLLSLAAKNASSECPVINGGTGEAVTNREILTHIATRMKSTGSLAFSGERRVGDPVDYQADIGFATSLGWQPTVRWQTGVSAVVDWFQAGAE